MTGTVLVTDNTLLPSKLEVVNSLSIIEHFKYYHVGTQGILSLFRKNF